MYTEEQNDFYQKDWNYFVNEAKNSLGNYSEYSICDDLIMWLQYKLDTLQHNLALSTTYMDEIATRAENLDRKFLELQAAYEKGEVS